MKSLKNLSELIETAFFSGIVVLLASYLPVTQAQTSTPSTNTRAVPALVKQQAATVPYQELVKLHFDYQGDGSQTYGKTVQVGVNGKLAIGYFTQRSDEITFLCKSGDKKLTSGKSFKGVMQGVVVENDYYEGVTVFMLKNCQIIK